MNKTVNFQIEEAMRNGYELALKEVEESVAIIKQWQESPEWDLVQALRRYSNARAVINALL